MSFGELVQSYRYRANLSLSDLAQRTGLSRSVLSRIEAGATKRPGFSTCRTIAAALQIPYEHVIVYHLDLSERAETLKMLLVEAVAHTNRHIVRKAAVKLLESPKMNTLLAMDYLLQQARESEDPEIRFTLYDVIVEHAKKRGIPYYLAKGLLERYLIERYDFTRLEETYRRGRELLTYIEYLQPAERAVAYYRLGLQAYALNFFGECIQLCRLGIKEDAENSELKASALVAITNSYIAMGDLVLAELYLKEYQGDPFADCRRVRYHQALLHAKKKEYDKAIPELKSCLAEADRDARIAVAVDLLRTCLEIGDFQTAKEVIANEEQILPEQMNTPKKIEFTALYCKLRGMLEFAHGWFDSGVESMIRSVSHYREIGAYAEMNACIGAILAHCRENKKFLLDEHLEILVDLCNNSRETIVINGGI